MKHIRATLALGNCRTETVAFPCADSKIKQMLAHRTDDDRYTVYVDELTEPAWMKPIEKTYVNIHELNYLARRMDAMDDNELAKMGAALSRFGVSDLSQSINYTFNLNRITLVRDISNLQKVGAMHYMETHGGCCTSEEYNNPQRAAEARELLERGNGILTDYGLLFINDEVPFEPVYNGVNFPEYWYEGMDKTGVELTYQDRKEYLYCPCEDESVEFALERLGADSVEQCGAEITCIPFGVKLGERVEGVLHNEGFHAFNAFCKRIEFLTTDEQDKLEAVVLYADATTSDELTRITDHLNDFVFAPGAQEYDPFGEVLSITDANGRRVLSSDHPGNLNPFRFRGYFYDAETGWYCIRGRYYYPRLGRYLSPDVDGLAGLSAFPRKWNLFAL